MAIDFYNPNRIEPPEIETQYTCPECGAELSSDDFVFVNDCGVIVGCPNCVSEKLAEGVFDDDH